MSEQSPQNRMSYLIATNLWAVVMALVAALASYAGNEELAVSAGLMTAILAVPQVVVETVARLRR